MARSHRVVIIGVGRVGATAAFALLHTGLVRELVLIDHDRARAEGEAMDLAHAKIDFIDLYDRNPTSTDRNVDVDEAWIRFGRASTDFGSRMCKSPFRYSASALP